MPKNILSSFRAFSESFEVPEADPRADALKIYFNRGGVISAVKTSKPWPKLIYPTPLRMDAQIKELEALRSHYGKKEKEWKEKLHGAKTYHQRHQVMKFSEPLYWQHTAKSLTDKEYKSDAQKVGLPVHLSADPKWKPMINMFVNDVEYRKNLVETVQTSIVYKKDKKVAKYADVLQALRSEISESKLADLKKKITQLDGEINALKSIKKWAQE
ncbi:MAG TPA: hypothetical protein VJH23_03735 [archaeon]|nr:hypothetical protein [archaeon]